MRPAIPLAVVLLLAILAGGLILEHAWS